MRLLIAESDAALGTFLQRSFDADHYAIDLASTGEEAVSLAQQNDYGAAILDLNLSGDSGSDVLRELRTKCPQLPILILTNRNRLDDRVHLLDMGADDFMIKPFAFSELSARVRALLRRGSRPPEMVLRVEDLELNRIEHTVRRAGRPIELTPKEFSLLEYLMRNIGQRVSRAEIIEHVWNLSFDTMTNVVDVYINYLRKKIDAQSDVKLIHTIRGVGYQLQAVEARSARDTAREHEPVAS